MKWYDIKKIHYIFSFFLLIPFNANAQSKYERHVERYQSAWQKLIPKYTKLQFAGSMGLLSAGIGLS